MADEIKLKAPTVEQQVVVNISGEEKLRSFADTLDKISNNKNLQKYWKTQQELINATANAYGNFQKKASKDNAIELIKVTNALKAMSGTDLSNILPDFDKISKAMAEAQKVAGNIDSAFSVKGFKEAFDSFETLKAYSEDIEKIFSHFGVSSDVGELQNNVRALEGEVEKLTRRLSNAKNANEELRNEFENFKSGSGFADKLDELDNLKYKMSYIREEAEETFRQFLKLNNVSEDGYDRDGFYDDNRFREYFQNIQSGYMSASDAIRQFKTEYSYLLEDSFKSNNDTFGLEQLQSFSNKLDSIFRQVEETSTKINDIISNGIITKSVENLSMDSSLSDSQRSLFGNLLQDEESLKSITALFQKLIEESNKTKNSELFNSEQLQQVLSIFDRIENSLSSLRSVISDVGDGEEFSPLLKVLNDIKEAASNIKLNFNMDLGDEVSERLNQKVSQASARQLEAYRKLFSAMKGTGKTNKEMLKFFEPDEASVTELIGTYKGIIERAEKQFKVGNSNIYKKYLGAEYDALKREITNANKQLSRADSKRSENGILGDLFGNTKDLSEVIEQLNKIVSELDEISSSVSEFKNVFKEGFNVTASVEEIDKLTNRVKELEDELAKIKLNPVDVDKSNISSENSIVEGQNKIQEELKETQENSTITNNSLQNDAKETTKNIHYVTNALGEVTVAYRGLRDTMAAGLSSNRYHGGTFWTDNLELAKEYSEYTKVESANLEMINPLEIEGNGANWNAIEYYGNGVDEASKKIIECKKNLESLIKKFGSWNHTYKIGETGADFNLSEFEKLIHEQFEDDGLPKDMLEEAQELLRIAQESYDTFHKISNDMGNVYGKHDTNTFVEMAKANGYDGVIFKNIIDSYSGSVKDLSNVMVTFDKEQIHFLETISTDPLERESYELRQTYGNISEYVGASVDEVKNKLIEVKPYIHEYVELLSELDKYDREYYTKGKLSEESEAEVKAIQDKMISLSLRDKLKEIPEIDAFTKKSPNMRWWDNQDLDSLSQQIVQRANEGQEAWSKLQSKIQETKSLNVETPMKDVFQGDDKVNTDASTTAIKEESQALEQVSTSAKDAASSKEKFAKANKEVKASADETVISVDKEISALEKAGNRFESQAAGLAIKPDDQHQFSSWKKQLEDLNVEIAEYKSKVEDLSKIDIADETQINKAKTEIENLGKSIKETITTMSKTPQTKRGWTDIGASKAAEKVANVLKQNTKMSKEAKDAIRAYYNELRSGNPSQPIDEILVKVNQLVQKERELGRVGKSFGEIFKEKVIYGGAAQLAGMVGFYDVINVGREIVTNIKEVDTALTELRKVSDATEQRLTTNFKNSADTAKELGATISDVISATADWSRMGFDIDESEELARVSTLYKNVGDGIDIETANNSLISTLQGFQLDASEAESIIDKFNEVANNYAIDSAGIGEALQRSAASFNAANTDLSKSIALITATNEVVQDPDSVGTLWKTMSARIRGAETELQQLNEETDEYTKTTSKLRDLVMGLTGFDIMEDKDTFKDIYEIILGIGQEWQNLTDAEQASLGEALAGKRNANALYAVLGNLDTLQAAYETAENSAGSAMREQENYEKSIQYSLDRLSASAQEWSNTLVSSDVIKWFVDLANAAVELSTALTPLGTLGIGAGLLASFKGAGRVKIAYPHSYTYACRNKTLYA